MILRQMEHGPVGRTIAQSGLPEFEDVLKPLKHGQFIRLSFCRGLHCYSRATKAEDLAKTRLHIHLVT
jgi:hypothetical protein